MLRLNSKNMSIIEIHASVLSIIIAFLSAYGLFVFGRLDELEHKAFSESLRINNVHLISKYRSPRHRFEHLQNIDPDSQYFAILRRMQEILAIRLAETGKEKPSALINSAAEQGIELICNMNVLENIYPFATYIYFDQDGKVVDKEIMEPIRFHSLGEIRKWVKDLDAAILAVNFLYLSRKAKLYELCGLAEKEWYRKFPLKEEKLRSLGTLSSGDIEDLLRSRAGISMLVDDFFKNMSESQTILLSVKKILEDYDLYKNRHISKQWFSVALILSCVAFTSGVILPLVMTKVSHVFRIFIPVAFYVVLIFCLVVKLLLA